MKRKLEKLGFETRIVSAVSGHGLPALIKRTAERLAELDKEREIRERNEVSRGADIESRFWIWDFGFGIGRTRVVGHSKLKIKNEGSGLISASRIHPGATRSDWRPAIQNPKSEIRNFPGALVMRGTAP